VDPRLLWQCCGGVHGRWRDGRMKDWRQFVKLKTLDLWNAIAFQTLFCHSKLKCMHFNSWKSSSSRRPACMFRGFDLLLRIANVIMQALSVETYCPRANDFQSQVIVLVSWKFKHLGEWFDWSINNVTAGKRVVWLAVKMCAEIDYTNRLVVRWIIINVLVLPVE